MKKSEEELKNLSYESDGKMGKQQYKREQEEDTIVKDFFNITPDSE
ncbi:hypothetical protein JOC85_000403 [Bacillus mesophilus]|uniref:Uncharacterized protein n=1 Tax=Bacillus mesophilus TaxID=1808955 RepID=A0A6M0Q2T9_9BACI|nr:hypothetical protein [Bacillus mesophilus]MBM7659636.1 hypothetical protein [Bacillus mesophilus]NEY70504.1 hypothetical protein [Bacillus mesophilus]